MDSAAGRASAASSYAERYGSITPGDRGGVCRAWSQGPVFLLRLFSSASLSNQLREFSWSKGDVVFRVNQQSIAVELEIQSGVERCFGKNDLYGEGVFCAVHAPLVAISGFAGTLRARSSPLVNDPRSWSHVSLPIGMRVSPIDVRTISAVTSS